MRVVQQHGKGGVGGGTKLLDHLRVVHVGGAPGFIFPMAVYLTQREERKTRRLIGGQHGIPLAQRDIQPPAER